MKNGVFVQDLVIEVCRSCNMGCDHCLRGDAQNLRMSFEMVDKILDVVSDYGTVVFTGGEPTLNLPVIEYFFKKVYDKLGYIPPFYIVTNGKENQLELAHLLLDAYAKRGDDSEEELYGVTISVDQFHDKVGNINHNPLTALAFYRHDKEHPVNEDAPRWLLDAGRANEHGLGMRAYFPHPDLVCSSYGDGDALQLCVDEMLYIAANGNIVGDCDMPYEDIDSKAVCTIDNLLDYVRQCVAINGFVAAAMA